jgi:hypothetical protein
VCGVGKEREKETREILCAVNDANKQKHKLMHQQIVFRFALIFSRFANGFEVVFCYQQVFGNICLNPSVNGPNGTNRDHKFLIKLAEIREVRKQTHSIESFESLMTIIMKVAETICTKSEGEIFS